MTKQFYPIIIPLLLIFTFDNCSYSTGPVNSDKFEINGEPISVEININPDSLQIEHAPSYSVDYSSLELNGINLTWVKYYYPDPNWDIEKDREFVVAADDSFMVEIEGCNGEYEWLVDLGNIELGNNNFYWINPEVALLRTEKVVNTDSSINYKFVFKTLKEGKGYICFIERDSLGLISSNESHGLLVGYSINALNKILLNIDEIKWKYNTKEGTFSTVSVSIKGTTNVYRLRGVTSGDGLLGAMEIPIENSNNFEIEIPVAFSHMEGIILKTSSKLLLYGTVGLPKIIPLVNPLSDIR